jgi:hypothetical protein
LRNPGLRRLQLAWAGSNLGTWGFGVALSVYAYEQGGAAAVGIVALLRLVPAAIADLDTTLLALQGEDFIAAVTGHAGSAEAAEAVVRSYGTGFGLSV